MNEPSATTSGLAGREARRDEAFAAIQDARDCGDLDRISVILAENGDVRQELEELLDAEAEFLGLPRPARPAPPEVDRVDLPGYEMLDEIAHGGWGAVVRARHRFLGREVAVKLLKRELATYPSAVARFLEEAQIASQLQHPGIAPVHEVGTTEDGRPYFVMKLVAGKTLADRLRERRSPADGLGRFLEIFLQVCRTLAYTYRTKGVLHRDLKPGNIMVGAFGEVQVLDWGLGKVVHGDEAEVSEAELAERVRTLRCDNPRIATEAGARVGTPAYMPPEQARGELHRIGPRSDVFGLGAILCEILTDWPPYAGTRSEVDALVRAGDLQPAFERLRSCGADADLIELACRCLAVEPEQRPADAGVVAESLAAYLDGLEEKRRRQERDAIAFRGRMALLVFGLLVVTAATVAGIWYRSQEALRAAETARQESEVALRAANRNRVAEEHLTAAENFLTQERLDDAREALGRVEGRVTEGVRGELQVRADVARRDLKFLVDREKIRKRGTLLVEGMAIDGASVAMGYAQAFRDWGADPNRSVEMAQAIRASRIRGALLAALDHWGTVAEPLLRPKLLHTAQLASDTSWAREFRDPQTRFSETALRRLIAEAPVEQMSAVEVQTLAEAVLYVRGDAEALLRRGQRMYPGDFWLNLLLAQSLDAKTRGLTAGVERRFRYEEAVSHVRAAIAVNPTSAYAQAVLGQMLLECERYDEAELALARAIRQPDLVIAYYTLARLRLLRGDVEAAENLCTEAIRFAPNVRPLHNLLQQIRAARPESPSAHR